MSKQKLKVWKMSNNATLPERQTPDSVGYDLAASADYQFEDGDFYLVATDVVVSVPKGYYLEIMLRSSLTKRGLMLANSVGIIDPDFCSPEDKIMVPMCKCHNGKDNSFKGRGYGVTTKLSGPVKISKGERIAQIIIRKSHLFDVEDMTGTENTNPVRGGFGSTNSK